MDEKLLAPCGAYCGVCAYLKKQRTPHCSGCGSHRGHPFWGECKLFACAAEHNVKHCGLCMDFPCDLFVNQYDPEHGQKSAFTRAGFLAYRRRAGTRKFVEMAKRLQAREEEQP